MYCRKCGQRLIDTAKFCPSCGTPVVPEDHPHDEQPPESTPEEEITPDSEEAQITENIPADQAASEDMSAPEDEKIPTGQKVSSAPPSPDVKVSTVKIERPSVSAAPAEEEQDGAVFYSQLEPDKKSEKTGRSKNRKKATGKSRGKLLGIVVGVVVLIVCIGGFFVFRKTGVISSESSAANKKLAEIALNTEPLGVNGTKYGFNPENYQNTEVSSWVYNDGTSYFTSFEGDKAWINWISDEETEDMVEVSLDEVLNAHLNYWDDCLYYLGTDGIKRIQTDGSNATTLVELSTEAGQKDYDNLMIYNGVMYLIEKDTKDNTVTSRVLRYDLNGEKIDAPISCDTDSAMMVYEDTVYLFGKDSSGFLTGTLYTCPVDGTKTEKSDLSLSGHVRYMIPYKNEFYYVCEDYSEGTGYTMVDFRKYNPITRETETIFEPKAGMTIRINHWCIILDNVYFCAVDSGENLSSFRQIYYQVYRLSLNSNSLGNVTLNQENVEIMSDYQYMASSCFTAGENIYMMSNAEAFPDGKVEAYTQPVLWLDLQELPFSGNELNAVKVSEEE